jgi:hypothetical protein
MQNEMGEACVTHEKMWNALKCIQKTQREEKLRIHRHKWEDNIRMDNEELGSEGVNWICRTRDDIWWRALLEAIMNLRYHIPCVWRP